MFLITIKTSIVVTEYLFCPEEFNIKCEKGYQEFLSQNNGFEPKLFSLWKLKRKKQVIDKEIQLLKYYSGTDEVETTLNFDQINPGRIKEQEQIQQIKANLGVENKTSSELLVILNEKLKEKNENSMNSLSLLAELRDGYDKYMDENHPNVKKYDNNTCDDRNCMFCRF